MHTRACLEAQTIAARKRCDCEGYTLPDPLLPPRYASRPLLPLCVPHQRAHRQESTRACAWQVHQARAVAHRSVGYVPLTTVRSVCSQSVARVVSRTVGRRGRDTWDRDQHTSDEPYRFFADGGGVWSIARRSRHARLRAPLGPRHLCTCPAWAVRLPVSPQGMAPPGIAALVLVRFGHAALGMAPAVVRHVHTRPPCWPVTLR